MKNILIGIGVLVVIIIAYYLISPAFVTVESDEASPFATRTIVMQDTEIKDNLETMDDATRIEFETQTEEAGKVVMEKDENMPTTTSGPTLLAEGTFKPRAHSVDGKALLIETDAGKIVRFEDFDTINGPNLHIYLASDASDDDFIDLGAIKATKGNVNYEIPEGIDTDKYNHVLVWCVPFKVLFSYAALT